MVFFCKGNMYHLDLNKAKEILEEEGHDSTQIGILLKNYPPLYDELKSAMDVWLEKREILDLDIKGFSIHDVIEKRSCHFFVAIRDLNRLLDPNLSAEKCEQWKRILSTPVKYE